MNERGFVTAGLLVLTPLLITIIALAAAAYFLLTSDSAARHECRLQLLKAQSEVANDLNKLLEMNDEALRLRLRREQAEAHVIATSGTPAVVFAEMELNAVINQQTFFAAQQRALILHARTISQQGPARAQIHVRPAAERTRARQDTPLQLQAAQKLGAFTVIASPLNSLTPDYQPAPRFSQHQEMRLQWSFLIDRFLPGWLRQYLATSGLHARAQCSATIEKENGRWEAKLSADK